MHTCMTGTTVSFSAPFLLSGMERSQPAGDYRIEHFWLRDVDTPQVSYSRTCSFIHLLPDEGGGEAHHFPIDPDDLRAALDRDRARCAPVASAARRR